MKSKIITLLTLLALFVPIISSAIPLPFVFLTIIVNTEQDAVFHYDLQGEFGDSVDIETQYLQGIQELVFFTNPGNIYTLSQDNVSGLKLDNVFCVSDNPNTIFSYQPDNVLFAPQVWENIICTFNNTKALTKNPVLIVPGLLGTEMFRDSEKLWPDVTEMIINPIDSFMDPLQFNNNLLPMDNNVEVGELVGEPFPGEHYYDGIIAEFIVQGYAENETLFALPYDWRYGVSGVYADGKTNVDLLKDKIDEVLQQTGADKVDVVAHSLGGLIVKKYAMNNPADNNIGKAVFVGVPNTGAPKAVKVLLQGDNFNILGLNDAEVKKISENMPAAYDLLPSQEYYIDNGSFMKTVNLDVGNLSFEEKDLDYDESKSFLTDDHNLNSQGMANAEALHSDDFDNYDLRTAGIDLYSINGCKSGTISKLTETTKTNIFGWTTATYDLKSATGDGTVPLSSAENLLVDDANVFYAKHPDHGKMLSQNGIKQQIVNIIADSQLNTGNKILTKSELEANPSACELTGFFGAIMSPVSIEITDQNGNRAGPTNDNSIQNEIPGADYQILGEHKFVYLPTGENQTYTINLKGEDNGTFTFKNSQIVNGQTTKTEIFSNLPASPNLMGQIHLSYSGNQPTTLVLDNDGNGTTDQSVEPSFVYEGEEPKDITPPEVVIEFDPNAQDLKFTPQDNSPVSVIDKDDLIILMDDVGNITEIQLKEKDRKTKMKAEIVSIKYNGIEANLSKNQMQFSWNLDKRTQNLKTLSQRAESKSNYNISAVFDSKTNTTKITGKDSSGKIRQTLTGLKIIKIITDRGGLEWEY